MKARAEQRSGQRDLRRYALASFPLLAGAFVFIWPLQAAEPESDRLVSLINEFRTSTPVCAGKRYADAGALAPAPELKGLELPRGGDLQTVLKAANYHAAAAQAIVLSGPRNARRAMDVLAKQYCEDIAQPKFSQIGVTREGNTWRIVLAQPLLAQNLGSWREAGQEILRLTNEARAVARSCGQQPFSPAPALSWNTRLAETARGHSADMARRNAFSHAGRGGREAGARAEAAGYEWRAIGENIATGQGSPQRVVAGWLASPTHCANLMNPRFTEMGAAYALNMHTGTGIFWTQVFGTPL